MASQLQESHASLETQHEAENTTPPVLEVTPSTCESAPTTNDETVDREEVTITEDVSISELPIISKDFVTNLLPDAQLDQIAKQPAEPKEENIPEPVWFPGQPMPWESQDYCQETIL